MLRDTPLGTRLANLPFARWRNGGKRALHFLLKHAGEPLQEDILTSLKTLTDAASELGKDAIESLDNAREETAGALHSAASSARRTGRQGSEAIDNLAAGAADRLDATASYIEDHDLRDAFRGLRRFGRRHLTGSLVFAAAIGFLAGAALNRLAHSDGRTSNGA